MSKPNYRVIVTYDADRKVFMARAPELEHCTGEGATRAEATARVEEEIDAQLANMVSHGATPPHAVDEEVFSGELSARVSKLLHRDLAYQARSEGLEIDALVGELVAAALESRKGTHRGPRSGNRAPQEHLPSDNIGNRHDGPRGGGGGGGRNFGNPRNNHQLLDDRANFIEYVRGLEQSGGAPRGGPGYGGGGGGGGPGGDRRGGRRRGRGSGSGGGGGGGGGNGRPMHHDNRQGMQRNGNPSAAGASPSAPPPAAPPPSGDGEGNS